jgi:hypothetical protein
MENKKRVGFMSLENSMYYRLLFTLVTLTLVGLAAADFTLVTLALAGLAVVDFALVTLVGLAAADFTLVTLALAFFL